MPSNNAPEMQPTRGLAGLTVNAMPLVAPSAFRWLTFSKRERKSGEAR